MKADAKSTPSGWKRSIGHLKNHFRMANLLIIKSMVLVNKLLSVAVGLLL